MREYVTPALDLPESSRNLTDDVFRRGVEDPDRVVCHRREGRGWQPVTAGRLRGDVVARAQLLLEHDVEPGERVAILGRTSYEWAVVDLATWCVGAVSVPLYDTASAHQVRQVLQDCGARAAFVESERHAQLLAGLSEELPDLGPVWPFDPASGLAGATSVRMPDPDSEAVEARRRGVTPSTLATLVYTSGSTGEARGCRLTHANLLFESSALAHVLRDLLDDDPSTLLVLPLAHVLGRVMQVTALREGIRLGFVPDMAHLLDDVHDFAPTLLLGVPRVLEKLFTQYSQRAAAEGHGRRFEAATETAIASSVGADSGGPGLVTRARHRVHERLVYAPLRAALGGRVRAALVGGAPMGDRLAHFYRGAGVPVLEGYGLTETTGAATVTAPGEVRVGRVGRPLPGTGVRVSDEGELLLRGPHVFDGYWGSPASAEEVVDAAGWLHTGDLGEIDADGTVRVTGRTREIIVTAGGKNVVPGPLEDAVRAHPLVDHCLVVGEDRPYVAALVTLDPDAALQWARARGKPTDLERLAADGDLLASVQEAVDRANAQVSQAESIRAFRVLPRAWSDETGELTPSLKLRRAAVVRAHRRDIAELYRS